MTSTIDTNLVEEYHRSKPDPKGECGFCYSSEQGKHGEVRRVWLEEFTQHVGICEKHAGVEADNNQWR